jgi:hypothetical protein
MVGYRQSRRRALGCSQRGIAQPNNALQLTAYSLLSLLGDGRKSPLPDSRTGEAR